MENLKKMAGIKAAEFVNDGMVVGLGTGSTAYYFVEEIGRRIKEEGLQITAVTTSSVTSKQAIHFIRPVDCHIDKIHLVNRLEWDIKPFSLFTSHTRSRYSCNL